MDNDIKKLLHFIAGGAVVMVVLIALIQAVDILADMVRLSVGV